MNHHYDHRTVVGLRREAHRLRVLIRKLEGTLQYRQRRDARIRLKRVEAELARRELDPSGQ